MTEALQRTGAGFRVTARAKINLTLEVFGKRPDGYHALRSVILPISLADTVEAEPSDGFSSDTGYPDDLCLKAARVLASRAPRGRSPVRLHVTKRIPAGGGLGGGSADAAAVLLGLNDLWKLRLTRAELAEVGAQVGSDVPALVLGGPVLMEGRGERVRPLACAFRLNLVVVRPDAFSSTKEVYAACVPRVPDETSATDEMCAALAAGDFGRIVDGLHNDLQEPAVRLHPEVGAALGALRDAGAAGVLMSGSGSCVFGLVPDEAEATRLAAEMSAGGLTAWAARGNPG